MRASRVPFTQVSDDPAEYCRRRYEQMIGEPWSELEKYVRQNCKPEHRWLFESIDQQRCWDEIEEKRLAQRPWWKKLLGITE